MGKLKAEAELFEGRHFDRKVIILCVRWYLRFKLSLRDLVEMMAERGLSMACDDHALGAALRPGVGEKLAPVCPGGSPWGNPHAPDRNYPRPPRGQPSLPRSPKPTQKVLHSSAIRSRGSEWRASTPDLPPVARTPNTLGRMALTGTAVWASAR